jgi:hypothetical protein
MPTTTNYGWTTPADTDLVKDGASAIRTLGTAIDTTVFNNAGAAIAKTIVDAKGDIIAATAADTVSRLAVGANDTVLTADSSTATGLKWAAPASGGMTLISTTTLTGATINLTSIPATYNDLRLVIRAYLPATDEDFLRFRFNADSNTRYIRGDYQTSYAAATAFGSTGIVSERNDNGVGTGLHIIDVFDYANTSTMKLAQYIGLTIDPTTTTSIRLAKAIAIYNQTSAISQINLDNLLGGNFTSGTALLYGVK